MVRLVALLVVVLPVFSILSEQGALLLGIEAHQRGLLLEAMVWSLVWRAVALFVVVGSVAYGHARWKYFRQHRMSLHELREEHREGEGDPHLKMARKHEHAALVMADLERRVRRSKVVVVRRAPRQQ